MIKDTNKEHWNELERDYPGITNTILNFEKAELPICIHCKSSNTAIVQIGVVGRTIAISGMTTKIRLLANGPRPGDYYCRTCDKYFGGDAKISHDERDAEESIVGEELTDDFEDDTWTDDTGSSEISINNEPVPLENFLPQLAKSTQMQKLLQNQFGSSKATSMILMMQDGKFSGDIGDELSVFIDDEIHNEAETKWKGIMLGGDDEYGIEIKCYHSIYYVCAVDMEEVGFFSDFEDARSYILSIYWSDVIDTTAVREIVGYNAIDFKNTLAILIKKMRLLGRLQMKFGATKINEMISLQNDDIVVKDIDDEILSFLGSQIRKHWKVEWRGYIKKYHKDANYSYDDYEVEIYGNHGVYYVEIQRSGSYGYFIDLGDAKAFISSQENIVPNYAVMRNFRQGLIIVDMLK